MKWTKEIETGIPVIDEQHKQLLEMISDLESLVDDFELARYETVVDRLSNYISFHFETEEYLMEQAQYIGLESHIKKHRAFKQEVDKLKASKYSIDLHREAIEFLKAWIAKHVQEEDFKYVDVVKKIL